MSNIPILNYMFGKDFELSNGKKMRYKLPTH